MKLDHRHPRASSRIPPCIASRGAYGVTLVELLVVIVLMGLLAGVVGLTMNSTPGTVALDPLMARVMAARDSALRTGHPVTIHITTERDVHHATAFPDGRVLTDAPLAIDALSGSASRMRANAGPISTSRLDGHATP